MKKAGHILLLFFCSLAWVSAQSPFFINHRPAEQYAQATAELIYEDENSGMWLGTTGGLFFFDGISFYPYLKEDSTSNYVRSIFRDRSQLFWVGYDDGSIYHLKKQKLVRWQPEEGLPGVAVTGFSEDGQGRLWFSTYGEGLYFIDKKRLYNINSDDGLLGDDIYVMAPDKDGNIWIGTDSGINICSFKNQQKKLSALTRKDGLPDYIVREILPDASGNMWIGTYEGGVSRYNWATKKIENPLPRWGGAIVTSLELFEQKELWIGTEGAGIYRYSLDDGGLSSLPNFANAKVFDLLKDTEGNIWTLTNNNGISSANRQFEFIEADFENMQAIFIDRENNLWAGTENGLFFYQPNENGQGRFQPHLADLGLNIISLFEDEYGNLWIGTFGKGLFCYQKETGRLEQFTEKDGLTNDNVLSIDGIGGHLWLATLGGATEMTYQKDVFENGKLAFHNFNQEDGLGTNFIYKVFIDSQKRAWFGTDGKGISVLENGKITNYPTAEHGRHGEKGQKEGAKLNAVYSITEDHAGHIWLSTDKSGIYEFDGENFSHLTVKEGIRNLKISSLATDANGKVVIVHPSGVDILTPETHHLIYYDDDVGIHDIDPNINAFCKDRFGNIWIGTNKAIIKYTALKEDLEIHPRTLLDKVSVFLEPIDFHAVNSFGHQQNNFVFNYTGLWYTDPKVVKYRYQLEGYDPGWIESKDRQATYSSLPSGDYVFKITSTENDAWSDEPIIKYGFKIQSPFWSQFWFIALCLLTLGGLSYWLVKNWDKKLQRENMLERIKAESELNVLKAQINPHFLFNIFNTLVAVIEEDPATAVVYIEKLADFYRSMLQLRDREIISLQEEIELVKNYAYLLEKRYGKNFRLNININGEDAYVVPLALQMLVENAVKHNVISKAKPLFVEIKRDGEDYVSVINNLQPKINKEASTHFGLQSLSRRYALLANKKIIVQKTDAQFKISIPLIE
ncbi:MAG TPA: hypothetical protein ENJ95_06770 [Bacteroidetes bacterium]|nr:hypothetical protein [Bacteroidota bacterium]